MSPSPPVRQRPRSRRPKEPARAPAPAQLGLAGANEDGGAFRRNLALTALIHLLGVAAWYAISQPTSAVKQPDQIVWLDGGSLGAPALSSTTSALPGTTLDLPAEPPLPVASPIEEPTLVLLEPIPEPTPEPEAAPRQTVSEIVIPKATPTPTPKPRPKATPKPTPKTTPKPKPAPKATPLATPKAKTEATPKPPVKAKAKTTPTPSAKAAPPAASKPEENTADLGPSTKGTESKLESGNGAQDASTPGGIGNGKGPNKVGKGTGEGGVSEFGWYHSMIQERFTIGWDQPTSIVRSSLNFSTRIKIRIARDGTILAREIVSSSGNNVMDASVLAAATKVEKIDALPSGLGGDSYEVNVDFKLDQGG